MKINNTLVVDSTKTRAYVKVNNIVTIDSTKTRLKQVVVGDIQNDAIDSGAPIKVGGKANTLRPTAVASGDRVNAFFDELGRLHTIDDGAMVQPNYYAGLGFEGTAEFTTDTTITITGSPFTVDASQAYVTWVKYKATAAGSPWKTIRNGSAASITAASGVITVNGFPVGGKPFASGDSYVIGIRYAEKAYDATTDGLKMAENAPLNNKYLSQVLVDSTNTGVAATITNYYPSATGLDQAGFKDFVLQFQTAGGVTTTVEACNESTYTYWSDITKAGFELVTNSAGNASFVDTNGIVDFSDLNILAIRIKKVTTDATNTVRYFIRQKAL